MFVGTITKVNFISSHLINYIFVILTGQHCNTVDADLNHLLGGVFVRFLQGKVTPSFPFPYYTFWKDVTIAQHTLTVHFIEGRVMYMNYLEFSSTGFISYLLLFIQSLICINMNTWILTLYFRLSSSATLFIFSQLWPLGVLAFGSCLPLRISVIAFFCFVLIISWLPSMTKCSRIILDVFLSQFLE